MTRSVIGLLAALGLASLGGGMPPQAASDDWIALFDGRSLAGWTQAQGANVLF